MRKTLYIFFFYYFASDLRKIVKIWDMGSKIMVADFLKLFELMKKKNLNIPTSSLL